MPKHETSRKSVREADQDAIVQFSRLPEAQTKRCLILKAFEKMMLKKQPEQTFHFLDRNYVEEFKDRNTMRQILSQTMSRMQPDIVTEYYEMLDGLLISMYFKNPPGRLLRKQWTHPVRCIPDFADWRQFIKGSDIEIDRERMLDIGNN